MKLLGLTRKEIIANSSLMIFAGYETTSTAILFLLYNLALHNDCQERLREEVRESMERHGVCTLLTTYII